MSPASCNRVRTVSGLPGNPPDAEPLARQVGDGSYLVFGSFVLSSGIGVSFPIRGRPTFKWSDLSKDRLFILEEHDEIELTDYLSHHPLVFFLEDFSRIEGNTFRRNKNERILLQPNQLMPLPWSGVDIEQEISIAGLNTNKPTSVQDFLGADLIKSTAEIVFFDHGSGEIADFIAFTQLNSDALEVALYHCKGSGGKNPGDRVGEAYEVCGQVSKSLVWLKSKADLRARILGRDKTGNSKFIKGTQGQLLKLLADDRPSKLEFKIAVVQPGISVTKISERVGHILGATSDYVMRASGAKMLLVASN